METIGKYQIQKVLGRGGMGTVYEALDPLINRKVAIKTMIQGLAESPDLRTRFLREAQAAGGLRHRNIVTVYDLGEDKGQPYIAMEFIEGTDLEKIIQNKEPLTVEWKLDVLRQICDGLGYAHRSGIVHRDIKPANIRVTHDGEVKIMDFGIAHLQSSTMTKSGLVLGTVHYMSPEQIEGRKVDHRADIFSVGAIAYELIAYRKPFDGESLTAVMFKIIHDRADPKPLTTEYSPQLEGVVMKALSRDANERYQRLDDMQADIEDLMRSAGARVPERSASPTIAETERDRGAKAARKVEEGQQLLARGELEAAATRAKEALTIAPSDASAQELLRITDAKVVARKVEKEIEEIRAAMERARAEGQLQKALALCRRLLELRPDDKAVAKLGSEIEMAIREREVEQLCGLALTYAAEGDTELAQKIAGKIERLSPRSPRYLQLKGYLEEEIRRRQAGAHIATAQDHLALGNLEEALAAAEEALGVQSGHPVAREIQQRARAVLAARAPKPAKPAPPAPKAAAPPAAPAAKTVSAPPAAAAVATPVPVAAPPAPPPKPAAPQAAQKPVVPAALAPRPSAAPKPPAPAPAAPPAPPPLTPLPEGEPRNPEAAALVTTARQLLRDRLPQKALEPLEKAAALEPGHTGIERLLNTTRIEARRAEVEALTTAALNHFVHNNNAKARKAVEKALALDPANKKARELIKILGSLG